MIYRSLEHGSGLTTLRERLQSPKIQRRFDYDEAEKVAYYQFALPAQEPVGGIALGPQVTSRIFERVFWVAPKKGVMDKPKDMEAVLDEVSDGFYTEHTTARVKDDRLIYGRREFWIGPWQRRLNIELVALPHKTILEMLQNYFVNKESAHPVLSIEDRAGLAYSATPEQLRILQEQERQLAQESTQANVGSRGLEALVQRLGGVLKSLRGQ